MSSFLTYYNLSSIEEKDFIGTAVDRDEGNVITTLGRNIVTVIGISTQKQVLRWTLQDRLSSKVVYDRRSEKYVGVFMNSKIRCWDENTEDINECKILMFKKNIADLISVDEDTYVLFSDGSCDLLATAIKKRKMDIESTTEAVQLRNNSILTNGSIVSLSDGRQVLVYFQHHEGSDLLEMVIQSLEDGKAVHCPIKRENNEVKLAGHTIVLNDNGPHILTIWSDKMVFMLNLEAPNIQETSPGNFVSMITTFNVSTALSVVGLAKDYVAIYGANDGQEGASLIIYNIQFKIVKATQLFKVHFLNCRLWAMKDYILITMGQNLNIVSYRLSMNLLSDLLGTQINNHYQTAIESDYIDEEATLLDSLQYAGGAKLKFNNRKSNGKKVLPAAKNITTESTGQHYQSLQDFERALNDFNSLRMDVQLLELENMIENIKINLGSNDVTDNFIKSKFELMVRQMELCGASEYEITENLLSILIKANQPLDIEIFLKRYANVSEKMLAKTLNYTLNAIMELQSKDCQPTLLNGNSENHMDVDNEKDGNGTKHTLNDLMNVLNSVLSCAFDPKAIAVHIRREIEYDKMVFILDHFYNILTSDDDVSSFEPRSEQFEIHICQWISVLLTTHFHAISISKDLRLLETLGKYIILIENYKLNMAELTEVATVFYSLMRNKKADEKKSYSKWYSIEEVCLW